jgi:flagellin
VQRSGEGLASGQRINRAADDAAGLVISEGLRAELGGLQTANRNVQDGIGLTRTADGALGQATEVLQRMRELAVSAANATSNGTAEQAEIDQLAQQLDQIGSGTSFGGRAVFDGTDAVVQSGGESGVVTTVQTGTVSAGGLGVNTLDVSGSPAAAIEAIDAALAGVTEQRGRIGAQEQQLTSTSRNLSTQYGNALDAESRIRDQDMAEGVTKHSGDLILRDAAVAVQAQANVAASTVLQLLR